MVRTDNLTMALKEYGCSEYYYKLSGVGCVSCYHICPDNGNDWSECPEKCPECFKLFQTTPSEHISTGARSDKPVIEAQVIMSGETSTSPWLYGLVPVLVVVLVCFAVMFVLYKTMPCAKQGMDNIFKRCANGRIHSEGKATQAGQGLDVSGQEETGGRLSGQILPHPDDPAVHLDIPEESSSCTGFRLGAGSERVDINQQSSSNPQQPQNTQSTSEVVTSGTHRGRIKVPPLIPSSRPVQKLWRQLSNPETSFSRLRAASTIPSSPTTAQYPGQLGRCNRGSTCDDIECMTPRTPLLVNSPVGGSLSPGPATPPGHTDWVPPTNTYGTARIVPGKKSFENLYKI